MNPTDRDSSGNFQAFYDSHPVAVLSELDGLSTRDQDSRTLVKQLLADMRRHWAAGRRPVAEQYLATLPADAETELIVDLIYGEFLLRQECGEPASTEFMLARFPRYRAELARQFEFDDMLMPTVEREQQTTLPLHSGARHPLFTGKPFPQPFGKYVLIAPLDSGGQAEVYLALHTALRKDVVIKLGTHVLDTMTPDRLLEEGRILVRLEHPALARVYDLDVHEGHPYVVLEYVRGMALSQFHRQTPLAPREAATLVAKIAQAVAYSHRQQVLHLDIKPKNVLVDGAGEPRLIDFGLAQLNEAWSPRLAALGVSGTLQYMAPEQASRGQQEIGPAADIYALGGILYFLLTNQSPHTGRTEDDLLQSIVDNSWDRQKLDDKAIPRRLREICLRTMATQPHERYASAELLAADLERFTKRSSRRGFLALGVLAALAAIVGLAWLCFPKTLPALGKPSLAIDVWDIQQFVSLTERLPLLRRDEVRFRATIPPHCHAALLHFDSDGIWQVLKRWEVGAQGETALFPPAGQALPLTGTRGTELVVLCVSHKPLAIEALSNWRPGSQPLPPLPPNSLAYLDNQRGVWTEHFGKGFGTPESHSDPAGEVVESLAKLASELDALGVQFQGLGFFHR